MHARMDGKAGGQEDTIFSLEMHCTRSENHPWSEYQDVQVQTIKNKLLYHKHVF